MAVKPKVKVRERELKDGRIRLCYDVYRQGNRELRTDERTVYLLPTDSDQVKAQKRARAEIKAEEIKLALLKDEYTFRNAKPHKASDVDATAYPTFLSLFEAEAKRRSQVLAKKQEAKIKGGRQVHKKTHDDVHYCLQRFKTFLQGKGLKELHYQDFTLRLVEQFKDYLLEEARKKCTKFCKNTAAAYLKKLKTVALLAHRDGLIKGRVVSRAYPVISLDEFERKCLTEEQIGMLLADLRNSDGDTLFKRAFLFSCYVSLRFGDLVTIKWVNVKDDRLIFAPGKNGGNKLLRLKLNKVALFLAGERTNEEDVIFPLQYSSALNDKLNLWILSNGINMGRITWHSGRHSCATMILRKTNSIVTVQKILGHSRIDTTMLYTKLLDNEMEKAMDAIDVELPEA